MRRTLVTFLICGLALAANPAFSAITKAERKELKKTWTETLYLRVDAPCSTGRHAYGTYKKPLVEVTPEGINTDTETTASASMFHADTTYWGLRINDPVVIEDFDFGDDGVEVELQGVGAVEEESTVIKLVGVDSVDEIKQAIDKVLSPEPLQNGHDDWSAEIKEAIGQRRLVNGMNKRQAFYVTGQPEKFEKSTEDGKEVEIWKLRLEKGVKLGYFKATADKVTGLPETIRFEDGILVNVGDSGSGTSSGFSID